MGSLMLCGNHGLLRSGATFGNYSPLNLFKNNEQGVWYDPSDLTTLFQDSAGTTPVTAVGQPVGRMLDKSRSNINATIFTDNCNSFAGWTNVIGTGTSVGGRIRITRPIDNTIGRASKPITCVVGRTYKLSIERYNGTTSNTSSSIGITISSTSIGGALIDNSTTAQGTYTIFFTATQTTHWIFLMTPNGANIGDYCEFDNIVVTEQIGNHAIQSTAINRPILSNRYNLLSRTEEFNDGTWFRPMGTITSNNVVAPDGTTTGDTYSAIAQPQQFFIQQDLPTLSVSVGNSYTASIYVKNASPNLQLAITRNGSGTYEETRQAIPVSTEWQKVTVERTFANAQTGISLRLWNQQAGQNISVELWGASIVPTQQANLPYQRVNASNVYDSDVTKFPPYLSCNGTNSTMRTESTLNMTASDKVMVVAGVRKLTDASAGLIAELGNLSLDTNGCFALVSRTEPASYGYRSRGTILSSTFSTGSPYPAPHTAVLTGQSDIANDIALIRANGSLLAISNTDQGLGNFSNNILYLFARQNTSLFLNGNFYGLIIRGTATSDSDRIKAEKFMSKKTGL